MHREIYFTADIDTATKPYQVRDGASGRIRTSDRSVVAEYSIQLSYGCIGKLTLLQFFDTATKAVSSKRWCIREDSRLAARPSGRC